MESERACRKLADLRPHPLHDRYFPEQSRVKVEALAANISEYGLRDPVEILPDNTIVAGRHRALAAELLGWDEVDVVVRHDLAAQGAEAVEEFLIRENVDRRQCSKMELAGAFERLLALAENRRDFDDAEREVGLLRARFAELGLKERELNRYRAVLRTPPAVQRAFQERALSLVLAGRVAGLPAAKQAAIASAIEAGETPAEVVAEHLDVERRERGDEFGRRFLAFVRRARPVLADLEESLERLYLATGDADEAIRFLERFAAVAPVAIARIRETNAHHGDNRRRVFARLAEIRRAREGNGAPAPADDPAPEVAPRPRRNLTPAPEPAPPRRNLTPAPEVAPPRRNLTPVPVPAPRRRPRG
jgi:ParB-like chromosome segregation protein Spo0J